MSAPSFIQNSPALAFATISMMRSGLLSVRRAFPILLGSNTGSTLLMLIVMLDIKLAALYILGISQLIIMIMVRDRMSRYRTAAITFSGMAMMILGVSMLKEFLAPLVDPGSRRLCNGPASSLWPVAHS